MDKRMKILVLPGDGVGPEVTSEALKVINVISKIYNLEYRYTRRFFRWSCSRQIWLSIPRRDKK